MRILLLLLAAAMAAHAQSMPSMTTIQPTDVIRDSRGVINTNFTNLATYKAEGAASSTDNALARYDGVGGKLLQNSLVTLSDTGVVTIPNNVWFTALTSGAVVRELFKLQTGNVLQLGDTTNRLTGIYHYADTYHLFQVQGSSNTKLYMDTQGVSVSYGLGPSSPDVFYVGSHANGSTRSSFSDILLRPMTAPGTPTNGQMWYDTSLGKFRCQEGGTTVNCIGSGSSLPSMTGQGGKYLRTDGSTAGWTFAPASYPFASVPSMAVGETVIINDALTQGNCGAGGGTAYAYCVWDGAALQPVGDGNSAASNTQYKLNGTNIGSPRSNFDIQPGSYMVSVPSDDGTNIDFPFNVDDSKIATRANVQAGASVYCNDTSGSSANYTCTLSPALTSYTLGMVMPFRPQTTSAAGALTVNAGPSSANIKQLDGTTDPGAGALVAGRGYLLWFDGTVFRVIAGLPSGGGASAINDLTDVTITSAADGHVLTYASGQLVNRPSYLAPAAYSSRPAANTVAPGTQFVATEMPYKWWLSDGISTWQPRLFGTPVVEPPAASSWTVVSPVADTLTDVAGAVRMDTADAGTDAVHAAMIAIPGDATWARIAELQFSGGANTAVTRFGVLFSEGTTAASHRYRFCGLEQTQYGGLRFSCGATEANFSTIGTTSNVWSGLYSAHLAPTIKLKIERTVTNKVISAYLWGRWVELYSEAWATTYTPTHIGWGGAFETGTNDNAAIILHSWESQ